MRLHNITHDDMLNGPGLRVVLWLAGCEHKCPGCQNPITWDPEGGILMTEWEEAELYDWLGKTWTQGITFSGGDPLHPCNREGVFKMARYIKSKWPEKDIWLYTGYSVGYKKKTGFTIKKGTETTEMPGLELIDVIVDGRFKQEIRDEDIRLKKLPMWRGSSNQRIIDIRKTISSGKLSYHPDDKIIVEEPNADTNLTKCASCGD